ncbi:MAG: alpha-glucuronidase family glycosyl hydrolase [Ignavibacteriales bacterium]|nr:alpha-glucuronidase family glycosyl hydrolase [Ignavibacteriales bacterium]
MGKSKVIIGLIFCFILSVPISAQDKSGNGLVGWWSFDQNSSADLSGSGNNAVINSKNFYDMGSGKYCIKMMPKDKPFSIPADSKSTLAIKSGTISFWVNSSTVDNYTLIDYDNGAFALRSYRGYLQPRFKGETKFNFAGGIQNEKWIDHLMREDAFYPHDKALIEENKWHQFAVAYDYENKKFTGWRDGELIAVIDLSGTDVESLKTDELKEILIGEGFTGFIDDLRIYDKVLNDADISKLYKETNSIYKDRDDVIKPDKKLNVYQYNDSDKVLYNAWLNNSKIVDNKYADLFKQIIIQSNNPTINTAGKEFKKAVNELFGTILPVKSTNESTGNILFGTPAESELIKSMSSQLGLSNVTNDGYVIKSLNFNGNSFLVIAANEPAGVVFGTFELIKKIKQQEDLTNLNVLSNPKVKIRIVGHWSWFRGTDGDDWNGGKINPFNREGNRYNSIYSWEDLKTGNTKLIEDWARLLASAGWNAVCPTEINWQEQNNFLHHLNEVITLARIFRNYGIKLYWSPNYLLALDKSTADSLYARVPDFGGYLLKLGSEAQLGNPLPKMVNEIAKNLLPYHGEILLRGFVYGKYRYTFITEEYRNTMQYDIYKPNDGKYLENVTIVGKSNPLDWDLAAPISPLDGAIQKTAYGTEMVIAKSWPASWLEKWKWWLDYDNYHNGKGSYNKNYIKCLLGVSMISPSPAWTSNPLNMVNYYGLGRLAWNPDLSLEQVYDEWISLTFGNDKMIHDKIKEILFMSDDVLKNQYIYRGYRGVWFDTSQDDLIEKKTTHCMNTEGIGIVSPELEKKVMEEYTPELQKIFNDPIKGEEFLPYFHFVKYDYKLTNGRTVIQDLFMNLDDAVAGAEKMLVYWNDLKNNINAKMFKYTQDNLVNYVEDVKDSRSKMIKIIEKLSGRKYSLEVGGK